MRKMRMRKTKHQVLFTAALLLWAMAPLAKAQGVDQEKSPAGASPALPEPASSTVKATKTDDPSLAGYTIGEQDVLDINVWREKELSGMVVVRPDGKITIPLLNEIYVIGMTPVQLQEMLTEKLHPFLTAPQVTVSVHTINSRKIYLMGQVKHAGVFQINSTTTVFQIITEAGGLGPFAKRKKIYVLRNVNGKEVRLPFNYDAVIKGQGNGQDLVLKLGDKIVVPGG